MREITDFPEGTSLLRLRSISRRFLLPHSLVRGQNPLSRKKEKKKEQTKMERSIGRQGPMMSPGMGRRPGGMPPRDSYQPHSYHQQQQQQSSSHQVNNIQQQQQQQQLLQQQPSQFQHSQHDELIRYIHEAWNSITQDKSQAPPVFYKSVPEPRLAGFTPFDLESLWGRRLGISTHGHQ